MLTFSPRRALFFLSCRDLGDRKAHQNFRKIFIINFKVTVVFIVLRIVEECYPLLVLFVLDHVGMQEILSQLQTDRSEELIVLLILHNNADDFFGLRILQWHHQVQTITIK